MSFKDLALEMSMEVVEAPIQSVSQEQMTLAVERMKVLVPDADKMSTAQLIQIANESLIYRTVPGRDMHYFIDRGKLCKVPDFKYMINFASFRKQFLSGDVKAVIDETYTVLSEEDKLRHGVLTNKLAVKCTLITARERKAFAAEVKQWIDLGFNPKESLTLAQQTYGELGTSAVGIVTPGGEYSAPNGWSPLQKAEKLAFKNAVNRKYGIPTADEMKAMTQRMAYRAMPEDWKNIDPTLPREQQARMAELEAAAREVAETRARMSDEEKKAQFARNVSLLRGDEEDIIDVTPTKTPAPTPTTTEPPAAPAAPAAKYPARPWDAETLRRYMTDKAATLGNGAEASPERRKAAVIALSAICGDNEDKRHAVTRFLFGNQSTKALTKGQVEAAIKWVGLDNAGLPNAHTISEVEAVAVAAGIEAGQLELLPEEVK
jgi:hypothetical protein